MPVASSVDPTDGEIFAANPRPVTRGDCMEGGVNEQRPCPWMSCKWHLATVRRTDRTDDQFAEEIVGMRESCVLDVADQDGGTLERVGEALDVTRERVRQIEAKALRRVGHNARSKRLEVFVEEGPPVRRRSEREKKTRQTYVSLARREGDATRVHVGGEGAEYLRHLEEIARPPKVVPVGQRNDGRPFDEFNQRRAGREQRARGEAERRERSLTW